MPLYQFLGTSLDFFPYLQPKLRKGKNRLGGQGETEVIITSTNTQRGSEIMRVPFPHLMLRKAKGCGAPSGETAEWRREQPEGSDGKKRCRYLEP